MWNVYNLKQIKKIKIETYKKKHLSILWEAKIKCSKFGLTFIVKRVV